MAFPTVKKVKEKNYLYIQSSRREGKKVISDCKYVCSLTDKEAYAIRSSKSNLSSKFLLNALGSISKRLLKLAVTKKTDTVIASAVHSIESMLNRDKVPAFFKDKINLQAHTGIKSSELINQTNNFFDRMSRFSGLSRESLDKLRFEIKSGKVLDTLPSLTNPRKRVLTIPPEKSTLRDTKAMYAKMVAEGVLDVMKKENGGAYNEAKSFFKDSYKISNDSICNYINNTESKRKFVQKINLRYFGAYSASYFKPAQLGLSKQRVNWRDEVTSIYGQIQAKGLAKVKNEVHREKSISSSSLKTAQAKYEATSAFRINAKARAKKKLEKAKARYRSVSQMKDKVEAVTTLFTCHSM